MRRATANRDHAIILVLLDTGLRASELCALNVGDVELKSGKVDVKHGIGGGAKGGKGRLVFLDRACRRTVWRFLAKREDGENPDAPLFIGRLDHRMNKGVLRKLIVGLGEKAGITKCHPHRFRHTFAITYLRSGGDVYTLQSMLGHSTLDTVQQYARVAQMAVEQAHRRASPADNWHLWGAIAEAISAAAAWLGRSSAFARLAARTELFGDWGNMAGFLDREKQRYLDFVRHSIYPPKAGRQGGVYRGSRRFGRGWLRRLGVLGISDATSRGRRASRHSRHSGRSHGQGHTLSDHH